MGAVPRSCPLPMCQSAGDPCLHLEAGQIKHPRTSMVCVQSLQLCPTLCNPVDCSPPGSSVHGIFQSRILEWLPFPPPGDLPDPRIKPMSPTSLALWANSLPLSHWGNPLYALFTQ